MDDVEAAAEPGDAERQQECRREAPDEFEDEGELRLRLDRAPVAVDLDAFDLFAGPVEAARLGADDADGVAVRGERGCLQPGPAVERHRQVLQNVKYAALASRGSG